MYTCLSYYSGPKKNPDKIAGLFALSDGRTRIDRCDLYSIRRDRNTSAQSETIPPCRSSNVHRFRKTVEGNDCRSWPRLTYTNQTMLGKSCPRQVPINARYLPTAEYLKMRMSMQRTLYNENLSLGIFFDFDLLF